MTDIAFFPNYFAPIKLASPPPTPRPCIDLLSDYEFLKVVGRGGYGKVLLARNKSDDQLVAVKVIERTKISSNGWLRVERERNVLIGNSRFPFLVSLRAYLDTEQRTFLMMDFASGGDFLSHLIRMGGRLDEQGVRFYSAEITCALGYLHSMGVLHRDLKLENILLDKYGHILLTDFGFCRQGITATEQTGTFLGSHGYMAPEIMLGRMYGRSVDWWSFGVIVYTMAFGLFPYGLTDDMLADPTAVCEALTEDRLTFDVSIGVSQCLVDFVRQLLHLNAEARLGSSQIDAEDVKMHRFYWDISWDDVEFKNYVPPFCPVEMLSGEEDVRFFDCTFTEQCVDKDEFTDFAYTG